MPPPPRRPRRSPARRSPEEAEKQAAKKAEKGRREEGRPKKAEPLPELKTTPLVPGPAMVVASNVNVRGQAKLKSEVVTRITKGREGDRDRGDCEEQFRPRGALGLGEDCPAARRACLGQHDVHQHQQLDRPPQEAERAQRPGRELQRHRAAAEGRRGEGGEDQGRLDGDRAAGQRLCVRGGAVSEPGSAEVAATPLRLSATPTPRRLHRLRRRAPAAAGADADAHHRGYRARGGAAADGAPAVPAPTPTAPPPLPTPRRS